MEELARLKKKLEKAIADADENEALDVIRALDRVTITMDSLGVHIVQSIKEDERLVE